MATNRGDDQLIGSNGRVDISGQAMPGRRIVTIAPTNGAPRGIVELDSARLGVGFRPAVMQRVPEDLRTVVETWIDAVEAE